MSVELLLLGVALSLDNFRTSVALGMLRPRLVRALLVALTFGLWDGLAPLAGLLLGRWSGVAMGSLVEYVGPVALAAYGGYLLHHAFRRGTTGEVDHAWALFGIPLSLSLDNLVAGTSLGLLGFSPLVSAAVLGATTAMMSFGGLQCGSLVARIVRVRCDLLSGAALVVTATVLALE